MRMANEDEPIRPGLHKQCGQRRWTKCQPKDEEVMASLVQHLHDFCRENEITVDEYMAGIDLVSAADYWVTARD